MGKKQRKKKRQREPEQPHVDPKRQRDAQMQRLTTYTGVTALILVVVIVGVYLITSRSPGSSGAGLGDFHPESQPSLGEANAPVKVVEFADFKCPACKAWHERIFPQLKEEYIDTGEVALYFLNFPIPLGQDSYTAADGAECIYRQNEEAFWEYYDIVYKFQGPERETWATSDALVNLVRDYVKPEIDEYAFRQCIVEQRYRSDVEADKRIGISAGVRATPTVFINDQKIEGVGAYSSYKQIIERELERAAP